jgi:hypothetical protein
MLQSALIVTSPILEWSYEFMNTSGVFATLPVAPSIFREDTREWDNWATRELFFGTLPGLISDCMSQSLLFGEAELGKVSRSEGRSLSRSQPESSSNVARPGWKEADAGQQGGNADLHVPKKRYGPELVPMFFLLPAILILASAFMLRKPCIGGPSDWPPSTSEDVESVSESEAVAQCEAIEGMAASETVNLDQLAYNISS